MVGSAQGHVARGRQQQKQPWLVIYAACAVRASRGVLQEEDCLLSALDQGHLSHAVLDVFSQEPLPKVRVCPHHLIQRQVTVTERHRLKMEKQTDRCQVHVECDNIARRGTLVALESSSIPYWLILFHVGRCSSAWYRVLS